MNTEKYVFFQNEEEEFDFTVAHKDENGTETIIAVTDSAEKAHFLASAANRYEHLETSQAGIELIAEERNRQIEKEGYTPHEDRQRYEDSNPLVYAAVAYVLPDELTTNWQIENIGHRSNFWPFDKPYWKPTPNDRVRELVKAGALIAAAIDLELSLNANKLQCTRKAK